MSLTDTPKTGSRIESLRALRNKLAEAIDTCDSGRDLAALSRQYTDVLEQIDELGGGLKPVEKTTLELLTEKRSRHAKAG